VLSAHPDTRGGGQLQTAGSQPIETPACPASALTEPPPGTAGDATPRPGRTSSPASSWPYNYKRGYWYPFVPAKGGKQRNTERELQIKAQVGESFPVEPDLERWFPLWGIPI